MSAARDAGAGAVTGSPRQNGAGDEPTLACGRHIGALAGAAARPGGNAMGSLRRSRTPLPAGKT